MAIFDRTIMKEILKVTCSILRNNFFYDDESLGRFIDEFTFDMSRELGNFEYIAEPHIVDELHNNRMARLYFTCYFTSANLRHIFINKLHFSEQELYAFENILPKFTGERQT